MATVGTATQTKTAQGTLEITVTGITHDATSVSVLSEGYPFGSVVVIVASGTAPTSATLQGSNDGTTFVALGTAATSFPAISALSTIASPSPCKFYNIVLVGGDSTTQVTAQFYLASQRG